MEPLADIRVAEQTQGDRPNSEGSSWQCRKALFWLLSGRAGFGTTLAVALLSAAATARAQSAADTGGEGVPQLAISHGLSYMTAFGPKNYAVVNLLYGIIIISLAVVTIIGVLVLVGSLKRGVMPEMGLARSIPLETGGSGLLFIYIGITISVLVLIASAIWNYYVLAEVAGPPANTVATIHVVGHQWWWEFGYSGEGVSREFTTANEIHLPVGKPVRLVINTADVIHSFWVPALTGKMDTIPGQNNVTWMQADRAGIYRGQCTEYCGQQHANMGLLVTAESPAQFQTWWDHQLQGPQTPSSQQVEMQANQGEQLFIRNCGACHSVRGTPADGKVGPDLSHLMDRKSLGAATLPNTIGALSGWVSNPQRMKPGNKMPTLDLSAADLNSIVTFLQTLR